MKIQKAVFKAPPCESEDSGDNWPSISHQQRRWASNWVRTCAGVDASDDGPVDGPAGRRRCRRRASRSARAYTVDHGRTTQRGRTSGFHGPTSRLRWRRRHRLASGYRERMPARLQQLANESASAAGWASDSACIWRRRTPVTTGQRVSIGAYSAAKTGQRLCKADAGDDESAINTPSGPSLV